MHIEKLANALVTNAVPSSLVGGAALGAVLRYGRKHSGLWVGGRVTATADGVRFAPNGMNRIFHEGLESTYIPMADIRSVVREFGWVTGIVVVKHAQGEFRFRCYGARRVAAILNSHAAAA
ncbi:hypothetical protein H1235_06635 [Pseudoxanthomonas sp. NC8]|nr:hypothetical protein H1235_06635 [Pseudoxanthomonas sp. NC8]